MKLFRLLLLCFCLGHCFLFARPAASLLARFPLDSPRAAFSEVICPSESWTGNCVSQGWARRIDCLEAWLDAFLLPTYFPRAPLLRIFNKRNLCQLCLSSSSSAASERAGKRIKGPGSSFQRCQLFFPHSLRQLLIIPDPETSKDVLSVA